MKDEFDDEVIDIGNSILPIGAAILNKEKEKELRNPIKEPNRTGRIKNIITSRD